MTFNEPLLSLYENSDHLVRLKRMVMKSMHENGIKSVVFTLLHNWREHIITKKKMKQYYDGKIHFDRGFQIRQNRYQESMHDDIDNFFENICIGKIIEIDKYTFFLPKLSENEVQMIQDQDIEYLNSFACYIKTRENPDIKPDEITPEMNEKESKTKFLRGGCRRVTLFLKLHVDYFDKIYNIHKNRKTMMTYVL